MATNQNEITEKLYLEVINIRHLLELSLRDELRKSIESVTTTEERRKIYAMLDGLSSTDQIAQKAGVSQRAVQLTVKDLANAGLVMAEKRGFPKRVFDYVPPEWGMEYVSGQ